ncbi:protein hairy-like [Penaeus japonicus]|uniref:protein hairy-like n=1 Tax=Penaeus japonicus TaxID=27405 RepID=UPI001C71264B|nr:protein hairy-like [Penaeus japonicus]
MGVPEAPDTKVKTPRPVTDGRRIRKPIMEKKRRDRINTCLDELSSLLQEERTVKAKAGKAAKLEKADVLELTVRYWQSIMAVRTRGSSPQLSPSGEPIEDSGYLKGYKHCISIVDSLLGDCKEGGTETFRQGLLEHLSEKVQMMSPRQDEKKSEGEMDSDAVKPLAETTMGCDTQSLALIPTLLPDGALALLLQEGVATTAFESRESEGEQAKEVSRPSVQLKSQISLFHPSAMPKDTKDTNNPDSSREDRSEGLLEVEDPLGKQYRHPGGNPTANPTAASPMEEGFTMDGIRQEFEGDTPMDTCADPMWRPW